MTSRSNTTSGTCILVALCALGCAAPLVHAVEFPGPAPGKAIPAK